MPSIRTPGNAKPKQTCTQCERTWYGKQDISEHFYDASSYCKDCAVIHETVRRETGQKYDVPKRIREDGYSAALRILYRRGYTGAEAGRRIAEDMLGRDFEEQ
jgi:hypothetical protein